MAAMGREGAHPAQCTASRGGMAPLHSLVRRESVSALDTLPAAAVSGCVRTSNTTRRTLACSLLLLVAACQMSIDVNCAGFKELA